jgi:hypothetical protein
LTNLFVVQDLPFLLLESSEFRDLLQLMCWNRSQEGHGIVVW